MIADPQADINWADLDRRRGGPEAHGLISVNEDSWPDVPGSTSRRAVASQEADNADSVRWYAHEILRLHGSQPSWPGMEHQLHRYDDGPGHR